MKAASKKIIIPQVVARPPWMQAARPATMAPRNSSAAGAASATRDVNPRRRFVPHMPSKVEVTGKQALAVTGGGLIGGAATIGLLAAGLPAGWTMGGLAAAGAFGMYSLKGLPRAASAGLVGGAALMLGASLAARYFIKTPGKQLAPKPAPQAPPIAAPPRQDSDGGMDVDEAFRNARYDDEDDDR